MSGGFKDTVKSVSSYVNKTRKIPGRLLNVYRSRPDSAKRVVLDFAARNYLKYADFLTSKKHAARALGYVVPYTLVTLPYEKFLLGMDSVESTISRLIPIVAQGFGLDYIIEKYDNTVKDATSKTKKTSVKGAADNLKSMVNITAANILFAVLHYKLFLGKEWDDVLALGLISTAISMPRSYLMNAGKNVFYGLLDIPSKVKPAKWVSNLKNGSKKYAATSIVAGSLALSALMLSIPSVRVINKDVPPPISVPVRSSSILDSDLPFNISQSMNSDSIDVLINNYDFFNYSNY